MASAFHLGRQLMFEFQTSFERAAPVDFRQIFRSVLSEFPSKSYSLIAVRIFITAFSTLFR